MCKFEPVNKKDRTQNVLYRQKHVEPIINAYLGGLSFLSFMASIFMIVSAALEFGFQLTHRQVEELKLLCFWVWITFLIDRGSRYLS